MTVIKGLVLLRKGTLSLISKPGAFPFFKMVLANLTSGDQDYIAAAFAQENKGVDWGANAASEDPGVLKKLVVLIC